MSDLRVQSVKALSGYLKKRIKQISGKSPTEISGSIALIKTDGWEDKLESQVNKALDVLIFSFERSANAPLKLTHTAIAIGQRIMDDDEYSKDVHIRVGDLFLEAFYIMSYIDIVRPGGMKSMAPIEVRPNKSLSFLIPGFDDSTPEVFKCTVTEKPDDTSKMTRRIGNYKGPVIKHSKRDAHLKLDEVWVEALDKMQQTAWKLNTKVFNATLANSYRFVIHKPGAATDREKSKIMAFNYTLRKAAMLQDLEIFYQGVDVDYRGRFYMIEPSLHYQGADVARGMMLFHEGKMLDENGLYWLSIHTASSFNQSYTVEELPEWLGVEDGVRVRDYAKHLTEEGLDSISVDKMHLTDQVEWVNQHMDKITQAGKDCEFWVDDDDEMSAEKPVTFLACCIELHEYFETPESQPYISYLPIPIDAHSSGWQHLATMTLDEQTGKFVGLIPSDIPIDFYLSVAKGVISYSKEVDQEVYEFLSGLSMKVIRKCITKRSSMILAYSAGKATLTNTIIDDSAAEGLVIPRPLATSIAKLVVETILIICPGPLRTMKYFQSLAEFELGTYGRFKRMNDDDKVYQSVQAIIDSGIEKPEWTEEQIELIKAMSNEYASLKRRKNAMFKKEEKLTEDELKEISILSEEISRYKSVLIHGNGSNKLTWKTPSGFNVSYESYYTFTKGINSYIATYGTSGYIHHIIHVDTEIPNKRQFISGISPNIVHSMDSSQLAMTCVRHSGTFAGIHDSFSTHACDVDELLFHAKETFIEMYEDGKFLERIKADILSDGSEFEHELPDTGALDMNGIRKSEGFFS